MLRLLADSLLDLVYPEECAVCGTSPGLAAWSGRGPRCPGLRFFDSPFLCAQCETGLGSGAVQGYAGEDGTGSLPVVAAARTNPVLVRLVGRFKYHGLRGLAWPLGRLLGEAWGVGLLEHGAVEGLVPVPLHPRRRRVRGFNQAEILCRQLSSSTGTPVLPDILKRTRKTSQQAKQDGTAGRRRNLEGAFTGRPRGEGGGPMRRVCLVDDLVTSGWTVRAAAEALRVGGWKVAWVLALGLATGGRNPGGRVDTGGGGF